MQVWRLVGLIFPAILWAAEPEGLREPFGSGLMAHKPTYLLPLMTDRISHEDGRMDTEAKFRLSFKRAVLTDPLGVGSTVYLAYSQLSLWQVWDVKRSRPFRETNYNPEIFIHIPAPSADKTFVKWYRAGIEHESNGKSLPKSRSWDRAYMAVGTGYGKWRFELKGWYRFPERERRDENDAQGDDNPDIDAYYGWGELRVIYGGDKSQLRLKGRHGSRGGAMELGYSYPVAGGLYFYAQIFSGYGESLIDYDRRVQKAGFGVMFSRGEI